MPQSLKNTWIALVIASLVVVVSGAFIFKSFVQHVFVDCRGTLKTVSLSELGDGGNLTKADNADLTIRYDEVKPSGASGAVPSTKDYQAYQPTKYKNVRVVWARSDSTCSCADASVKWDTNSTYTAPYSLRIYRDDATGLFTVRDPSGGKELVVFRKIDDNGHRFQAEKVFEPTNISMLVFLFALGALGVAAFRALSAAPYATRMYQWTPATLRHDGLVENEAGSTLGTMEARSRVPAGSIIVDPTVFEGRDAYREMPILTRRTVGAGSHERWAEGTMRRLRDSRSLSIIAMITTVFAIIAHVIS